MGPSEYIVYHILSILQHNNKYHIKSYKFISLYCYNFASGIFQYLMPNLFTESTLPILSVSSKSLTKASVTLSIFMTPNVCRDFWYNSMSTEDFGRDLMMSVSVYAGHRQTRRTPLLCTSG